MKTKSTSKFPLSVLLLVMGCGSGGGGVEDVSFVDATSDSGPVESGEAGPVDGTPCDDGDPCTKGDVWDAGVYAGTAYDCTTGSPFCVTRGCDGEGGCEVLNVQDGFCFVDGACFADGTANPKDVCAACNPLADQQAWSPSIGVTECSDGDSCTTDDHCESGSCVGSKAKDCDDKNPCTTDTCDAGLGCVHEHKEGPCDDGDECTVGDVCVDGTCVAGNDSPDCDDSNPCTIDSCDPEKGCVHDEDPETACDDNNECTLDTCDAQSGCAHDPVEGPCEDGDLCTLGDFCDGGECKTGDETPVCEDDNECTADSCNPLVGCIHANVPGECDDNESCTVDDVCLGGVCSGKKTELCPTCEIIANPDANKVTVLQMGTSGHPGQGLDLDNNPDTCAPSTDCSGGIDNELGLLAPFINQAITDAVENGYLMYVIEFDDFKDDGTPFAMYFHGADLASTDLLCDYQVQECSYVPIWASFDAECNPLVSFDNAVVSGNKISAGGPDHHFALQFNLVGGGKLEMSISGAHLEATFQMTQGGSQVSSMVGFIGGSVDKTELLNAVDNIPEEYFPIDKETVEGLLDTLIVNDLDTDGDGVPDAASVAIRFDTIPADIVPGE
ncbi:MAG: hypothetical protein GXP54_07520 [Deltaproteobacteria bacterium]|nr:hypothetical protein [Deltaproteobacteria bacterium]